MKVQYGDICFSQRRVYEWVERFQNGRRNVSDEHQSGRPVRVATETVRQQIKQGVHKLVDRWAKCVAKQGDYVENKTQTVSISTLVKSYYKIPVI
jgi:hypothetical protein